MNLRDKELWLDQHGATNTSLAGGMHRVNWTPVYGAYKWSRFADTYADAVDVLYNAVKSEMYYRANDRYQDKYGR